jgi:hypothetical protein
LSTAAARCKVGIGGHLRDGRVADPAVHGAVLARRRLHRRLVLQVVRQHDARDAPLVAGDAHRAVDEVAHLLGQRRHLHELVGDVLEQRDEVHLLLEVAAEGRALGLPTMATTGWWSSLAS